MLLHLIDLVLAMTLVEMAALALYHHRTGRGMAPLDFVPALGAGLALMLAVRAALSDATWTWMAAALIAAGLAHLADMRRRWPQRGA